MAGPCLGPLDQPPQLRRALRQAAGRVSTPVQTALSPGYNTVFTLYRPPRCTPCLQVPVRPAPRPSARAATAGRRGRWCGAARRRPGPVAGSAGRGWAAGTLAPPPATPHPARPVQRSRSSPAPVAARRSPAPARPPATSAAPPAANCWAASTTSATSYATQVRPVIVSLCFNADTVQVRARPAHSPWTGCVRAARAQCGCPARPPRRPVATPAASCWAARATTAWSAATAATARPACRW